MSNDIWDYLKSRKLKYQENHSLKSYSSIGIGASARCFVIPRSKDELVDLLSFLYDSGARYKLIGRMTNLLVCGDVYEGVIVSTADLRRKFAADCVLSAECGCSMPDLMRYAASLGLGGAEALATIPGSVGGCVVGNAGAFGVECSDIILDAEIYFPRTKELKVLAKSEMGFSYRSSLLKNSELYLLTARFGMTVRSRSDIEDSIGNIRAARSLSQPVGARSLGSIFKKANGVSAGYYIDRVGLKGYTVGGAAISDKHAGFIVNHGGASSDDVLALINKAKDAVFSSFGVTLEEEIEILR